MKSLYNSDGTPTSSFAAFRVNPDKDLPVGSPPIRGYFLALADNANDPFRLRLSLTTATVPEPSTLALCSVAGLMGLCAAWRRRRRKK